ncbi:MAG: helix-turn-helix transcriptional regulator [Solirubrobacteraceae bacterium]|nr:helix-turn-helix transcriptional regulator [Solirubrobacteraceae bacterium]
MASDYREIDPPPALRPYVRTLWVHRLDGPRPENGDRVLPDGRVDLVWHRLAGAQIAGPQTRWFHPPVAPKLLVYGARFDPGIAPAMLRAPASELADQHIALDGVDGRLAATLNDRLGDAPDDETALAALSDELLRRIRRAPEPDPAVAEAVRMLDRERASVADVAARTFVSERQLQRRFADHVGYSPKTLQRVLRFQRFLKVVDRFDLAGAAAVAGYSDQSHLTREARALAGLTPSRLRGWDH